MAVLGEIRNRPWLLMGIIAIAMLAFVVNPDSLEKLFGAKPGVYGKVNGDEITFIHSSTQLGVIVSSLKEPYYQRTFAQVNRVLE